jgi:6-phosphogluconolactonase
LVYFGTYTLGKSSSEGIYVSVLNVDSGALSTPKLAATAVNPSFVAIHPDGRTLYAVSETTADGDDPVGVTAYCVGDHGMLGKINERSSGGGGACHVAVDPTGQCLGVANYGGGSCASFSINDDGSLGPLASFHQHVGNSVNPKRQNEPHAHSINFNADGTQAFVADLGIDQILIYDVDPKTAKLTASKQPSLKMPAGSGPRHFCFAPGGNVALSNLELTSEVALLRYDRSEKTLSLKEVSSTLPTDVTITNNSTAECLVHPNGRYGYVSNRGHNSIAVFRIDETNSGIQWVENESTCGEIPRGFGISPGGKFIVVANQKSGNITTLRIDPQSGSLSPTGNEVQLDSPVNVRFAVR